MLDFIRELSVNGAKTARVNYGCHGWTAHHNSDFWRHSGQVGAYGNGDPVWACWPMGGAWLCQHLWEHYAFGGDIAYLREQAYPVMKSAAQFCLDWLIEDGHGHLVTAPATSPENKFTTPDSQYAAVSAASTMDMAIIWDLFFNAAMRSLQLRGDGGTGWSMAWKINFWARFQDGDHALKMLSVMLNLVENTGVVMEGGGVYANLFDAHPPSRSTATLALRRALLKCCCKATPVNCTCYQRCPVLGAMVTSKDSGRAAALPS